MPSTQRTEPDLRWLSACYFFFFSILGIMVPYLGVFFDSRGFNAQEIGFLLAILMATRVVAPNIWAAVADRTGMRAELIKLGSFAAAITYISFFFDGSFLYLAISLAIYTFFWNSILAQLEVITLETLGDKAEQYGSIRSWGSVGYIVLVISGGLAIDHWGPEVLPFMGMLLFLGLFACSVPLPANRSIVVNKSQRPKLSFDASLIWFMLSAMLLQMSVGPFYGFFVLYLKQFGYSETIAGVLVALGVLAEIVIFFYSSRLIRRYGIRVLLVVSILLTAIRWLLLAFGVEYILLLITSQLLHAFTFGLVHAASINFIHRHFNVSHRSTGQALYASVSFGVGGAIGTWVSGMIWGDGSNTMWVWIFAASCALLSMIAVIMIPNIHGESTANKLAS